MPHTQTSSLRYFPRVAFHSISDTSPFLEVATVVSATDTMNTFDRARMFHTHSHFGIGTNPRHRGKVGDAPDRPLPKRTPEQYIKSSDSVAMPCGACSD